MTEDPNVKPDEVQMAADDSRIVVVLDGATPVPKYVDFAGITPFHLLAIGEWLSLKGRQLIAAVEANAGSNMGLSSLDMNSDVVKEILGLSKP